MGSAQIDDTEWLTASQQRAWRKLVALITRLPAALDTQLQRDSALTHFDYSVLAELSEAPGRQLRLSELAQLSNASLSRLSHVVTKLEHAGWVRRQSVPGTRGSFAVLTDAGMTKLVEAAPGHVATVQALVFQGLDDEQVTALTELGTALLGQLDRGIAAGTGKA
ncbi:MULTISPECIES: MarR family winged helix-turn-helix transcriptional regulator [Rhodococcus]|uniref:MarR family transcriptional regulator n=3 Tax=Rhodococcus TaxID=1827 RepID=M2ZZJ1_9NOCA|nr:MULTISPECIES: MarR family transcriptional regulator [Rhodococcus]EME65734.1 MarR family transcriptional regulator [Rhodococcus ruber BKS 20-38]KOS54616.1 MarR family transcriptional regulator [Rhodococcus rhodochrous KG-21]MDM7488239.1 MarR family transcriptional regulator [Rhodococcus indonesiensis]